MADINHLLHINAKADTIYHALVSEIGLKGWWTEQTVVNSCARSYH